MSWLSRIFPVPKAGPKAAARGGRAGTLRKWLLRGALGVMGCGLLAWGGTWLWASGAVHRAGDRIAGAYYATTADMGFRVERVLVEGREYTDAQALSGLLNVREGDPIFAFDPVGARDMVEMLGWVKHARIERRLPDTVYVEITERRPMAFLRQGEKTVLIDETGAVLAEEGLSAFAGLITISGEGAAQAAPAFLGLLESEPDIRARVAVATYMGKRRWDLRMDNGLVVRLPETNVPLALSTLAEKQDEDKLLGKDAVAVDLRLLPEKLLIQTREGTAEERRAGRD